MIVVFFKKIISNFPPVALSRDLSSNRKAGSSNPKNTCFLPLLTVILDQDDHHIELRERAVK